MNRIALFLLAFVLIGLSSCKDDDNSPQASSLIFKFQFDETQARLDNFGIAAALPAGHAAQHPKFNWISGHFLELTTGPLVLPGDGEVLYEGAETTVGGAKAVDFTQARIVEEDETFFTIPTDFVAPGTYKYLRVSVDYQNYEIEYRALGFDLTGTIASFVGFNTYLTNYVIDQQTVFVNANKAQGYWGFETASQIIEGQAPQGATTVPNPIFSTSPIAAGSCLVTGEFDPPLVITGDETQDIVVNISLSINNSFEWIDGNGNGIFEPLDGETVVDMGLRGMIPTF